MARKRNKGKNQQRQSMRKQISGSDDPNALILDQLRLGNGRKALDYIRQARKSGSVRVSPALEFCALTARARDLRRTGNPGAADEMEQRAAAIRKTVALDEIPSRYVTEFTRFAYPGSAADAYLEIVSGPGSSPDAERGLAYHVVCERDWNKLDKLDSRHALRVGLPAMRDAAEAMDVGDWNAASRKLGGIASASPYAPWRMFCIAMQQLGRKDRTSLARTLSHLPEDFPLVETVKALKSYVGDTVHGTDPDVLAELGLLKKGAGTMHRGEVLDWLRAAVKEGFESKEIRQLVPVRFRQLGENLVPGNGRWAEKFLYDILVHVQADGCEDPDGFMFRLLGKATTPPSMSLAITRSMIRFQHKHRGAWNPENLALYLSRYKDDFCGEDDRRLARSILLAELVETRPRYTHPAGDFADEIEFLSLRLGKPLSIREFDIDLIELSIQEDPDHKPGYQALIEALKRQNYGAKEVEDVHLRMAERFPHDVEPLIAIAQMRFRRNAYRLAEDTVAQALEVAPGNPRILNLKAVSHLVSSDRGRKRGRVKPAFQDFLEAEALNRDIDPCVMAQKRLFLDLASSPARPETAIQKALEGRPLHEQLRILALQLKDQEETSHVKTHSDTQIELVRSMFGRKAAEATCLESRDVLSVLSVVPDDVAILYQDSHVAKHVRPHWRGLLDAMVAERTVFAYDILLDCNGKDEILLDISRRSRSVNVSPVARALLEFYRTALLFLRPGNIQWPRSTYSSYFEPFSDEKNPVTRTQLVAASKRLSRHFTGEFSRSLENFDLC